MRNESCQDEEEGVSYRVLYRDELPELPQLRFGRVINSAKFRIDGGWRNLKTYVGYLSESNKRQAAIKCPQLCSFINLDADFNFKGSMFHQLILRLLKLENDTNNYEYWFLVNGKPLRFSAFEFALISGLSFTHDEVESEAEELAKSTLKHDCFPEAGPNSITFKEVQEKLKSLKEQNVETEARLKLFFVLIVADVILHDRSLYIKDYIFQVCDCLDICNNYDWGKRCWSKTFSKIGDRVKVAEDNNLKAWRTDGCPWFILYWMLEAIQGMDKKFGSKRIHGTERIYPRMLRWKLGSIGVNNEKSADFLDNVNVVFPKLKADSTEKDFFYMKNLDQFMIKFQLSGNSYKELRDLKCLSIQERIQERSDSADKPQQKMTSSHPSTSSTDDTISSLPSTSNIDDTRWHYIEKRQTYGLPPTPNIDDTRLHDIEQRQTEIFQLQQQMMEMMEKMVKTHKIEKRLAEERYAQIMERMEKMEKQLASVELAQCREDNGSDVDAQEEVVAANWIMKDQPLVRRRGKLSSLLSSLIPFYQS